MSPQVAADIVRLVDEFSPPSRFGVGQSAEADTIFVAPCRTVEPEARTVPPAVRAHSLRVAL